MMQRVYKMEVIRMEQLLLTVSEAAETLRISKTHVYDLVRARKIPTNKLGKSVRIPIDELRKYLAETTIYPS